MKRSAAGLAALALLLTGCASGEETNDGTVRERSVELSDGRTVTCLTYKVGYAGGLSCDWGEG